MTPSLCLIVAAADNNVIGHDGKMPWHISSELKYFRARTLGKPVIMGRKTFQSIGKPLPGRDNIVISRDASFSAAGTTVATSLDAAIAAAQVAAAASGAQEIMVIGGSDIFRQALPLADRIYLTRVAATPAGDTFFPALDPLQWKRVGQSEIPANEADRIRATACVYERI